jgi:hypothetical protein
LVEADGFARAPRACPTRADARQQKKLTIFTDSL